MAKCKKCGAQITFIQSAKTKRWIPCNERLVEYKAGESPDYEDYVVNQRGEIVRCTFDFQCDPDGIARIPHWATCPYADDFRNR